MVTQPKAQEYNAQSLVDQLLETADRHRASDIHIEPQGAQLVIRFRIDGGLRPWRQLPIDYLPGVISRLKVMSSLDIAEKRLPQDGRFSVAFGPTRKRDFRISTVPQLEGEKAVVRVLHQELSNLEFGHIGYSKHNLKRYKELLSQPHGLLLHCGPTGSGKTTSLYTAINFLNDNSRNVQTIEDPVEGRLLGINQAQVNADIGLTFASLLRSILRQDPDVILVGEIRDTETAQLAVQASLTGHLVLGTLHTNSAAGAVSRMVEMDVSPFFVGTALSGVVSQRLVRRLCMSCRKEFQPAQRVVERLGIPANSVLYQAVGCGDCGSVGYHGRVCLQELLIVDDDLRYAIHDSRPEVEIQQLAEDQGMLTIFKDGLAKAVSGYTTVEEVMNVTRGAGATVPA